MSALAETIRPRAAFSGTFSWAGYLLGFAMGGFFDGILLHQILQWHHLLSGLDSPTLADIRAQVLADGLFHALMYAVAAAGLWLLRRGRREFGLPGADRLLFANFLIGFGAWHIADAVAFHWLLGLHRIRMDAENVLLWDLIFFGLGVAAVAAGWLMRRGTGSGGAPGCARRAAAPLSLAVAVLTAGPVAALPPANVSAVTVLFGAGTGARDVFTAVAAADGRVIWSNDAGDLWVIDVPDAERARLFYRHGALYVSGSFFPVGCFSSRAI